MVPSLPVSRPHVTLIQRKKGTGMRVNYRYPAMVTMQRRSASAAWRRLVAMMGQADLPEVSADDAPVAALVVDMGRGEPTALRYYDGRFYRQSTVSEFSERGSRLEHAMGVAICERLLGEKAYTASIAPSGPNGTAYDACWSLWLLARGGTAGLGHVPQVSDSIWAAMKPFDAVKMDAGMLEHWSQVAFEYVSTLIVLDGAIWTPVEEPMMRSELKGIWRTGKLVVEDASCYRNSYGRPSDLPPPYGSADHHSDGIAPLGPYWNPRCRYLSLPDAVNMAAERGEWLGDVLLPEAFTVDHAALQLDRAARVAAASITHILDDLGYVKSGAFGDHQAALKRVTRGRFERVDLEKVRDTLEAFQDHLKAHGGYCGTRDREYLERMDLGLMIADAIAGWEDRPVELALGLDSSANRPRLP